jgi:hypothetical protein
LLVVNAHRPPPKSQKNKQGRAALDLTAELRKGDSHERV